jgi:hypothetical protein
VNSEFNGHQPHLGAGIQEARRFFAVGLKFFLTLPILSKSHCLCQITGSRNFGNRVSEIETLRVSKFLVCGFFRLSGIRPGAGHEF